MVVYLFIVLLSLCLVSAQSLWGSTAKANNPELHNYSTHEFLIKMLQSPKVWLGAALYVVGTLAYFVILSKIKFFSVQIALTGLAILLSTLVAAVVFHEKITPVNIVGMILILLALPLVLSR
jgi:multidrug transporter EmrE-like cation transporter